MTELHHLNYRKDESINMVGALAQLAEIVDARDARRLAFQDAADREFIGGLANGLIGALKSREGRFALLGLSLIGLNGALGGIADAHAAGLDTHGHAGADGLGISAGHGMDVDNHPIIADLGEVSIGGGQTVNVSIAENFGMAGYLGKTSFYDNPAISREVLARLGNPAGWTVVHVEVGGVDRMNLSDGRIGADQEVRPRIMSLAIGPKWEMWMAAELIGSDGDPALGLIDPSRFKQTVEKGKLALVPLEAAARNGNSVSVRPVGGSEPILRLDMGNGEVSLQIINPDHPEDFSCSVAGAVKGVNRPDSIDNIPQTPTAIESPSQVLLDLGYNVADHPSFDPSNYRIEGASLLHRDSATGEERVDGMKVNPAGGREEWVRGLWYEAKKYPMTGGIALDVLVHPLQPDRAYFADPELGPDAMYGEFLKAIAFQLGIDEKQFSQYLEAHNYMVEIRLPEAVIPGSKASPSRLKASEPVLVDLHKPIVYAARAEPYLSQPLENGATIPENAKFIIGNSKGRFAMFVDDGQLFIVDSFGGIVTTRKGGWVSDGMYTAFELLARMSNGFVDSDGADKLLDRVLRLRTARVADGVINRDVFWIANTGFTDYEESLFELR